MTWSWAITLVALAAIALPAEAGERLKVLARIGVGAEPLGLERTADGRILVVAVQEKALYAIDTGRRQVVGRLDLTSHGRLNRVIADPATRAIFVTASVKGKVVVVDWEITRVTGVIGVGAFPQGMALYGKYLLVANTAGRSISVIDTGQGKVIRTIDAGDRPHSLAVDRPRQRLIVVKSTTRSVWTFDLAGYRKTRTITNRALTRPMDVVAVADGTLLLVDSKQDKLLRIAGDDGRVLGEIELADPACPDCGAFIPTAVTLSPDGRSAAVASRNGAISLIDVAENRLLASRIVGRDLRDVVFVNRDRIAVTSFATGEVVVVDGAVADR
ncbi:MAG: hypothetical protein ACE5KF_00705 [Kiloniellaceae bacterium]